jgi:hypothetical protein
MIGTVRSFVARTMAVRIFMRTEWPCVPELLISPALEDHHAICVFIHPLRRGLHVFSFIDKDRFRVFLFFCFGLSFVIFKGMKISQMFSHFFEYTFKKFPKFCCCHNVKNYYPKKKKHWKCHMIFHPLTRGLCDFSLINRRLPWNHRSYVW